MAHVHIHEEAKKKFRRNEPDYAWSPALQPETNRLKRAPGHVDNITNVTKLSLPADVTNQAAKLYFIYATL